MAIVVYRYDDEDYPDGKVIRSRGDHMETLKADRRPVERAIRDQLPNKGEVRETSLYTWEDRATATRLAKRSNSKFLYELNVEPADIRCRFDVELFSDATDEKMGPAFEGAVRRFCAGKTGGKSGLSPKIEVLVTQATVIRKLVI